MDLNLFRYKTPPSFYTTAAEIEANAEALIEATSHLCNKIVNEINPQSANFKNTIRPFAEDENLRSEKEKHLRFYASTHPIKELREASYAVANLFNNAEADLFSRADYFVLADSVLDKEKAAHPPTLDDESMHYLIKFHQRFVMSGCGIAEAEGRSEFVGKRKRISELAKQSRKNMANEKTDLWLTRDELRGMSESFLSKLTEGVDEHAGYLWVPTKNPFSLPIVNYATEEATRKRVYYAVMNSMPENIPLHRELVLLGDETARLLGRPNHFAFKTSQKMVGSPEAVHRLLAEVRSTLTPVAEQAAEQLREPKLAEASSRGESVDDVKLSTGIGHTSRLNWTSRLGTQSP